MKGLKPCSTTCTCSIDVNIKQTNHTLGLLTVRVHCCGVVTAASLNIVTVTGTDMIQHWTALSLKDVRGVRSEHTRGVAAVIDTVGDVRVHASDVHSEGRSPGDDIVGITDIHVSWGVQYSCTKEETEPALTH